MKNHLSLKIYVIDIVIAVMTYMKRFCIIVLMKLKAILKNLYQLEIHVNTYVTVTWTLMIKVYS